MGLRVQAGEGEGGGEAGEVGLRVQAGEEAQSKVGGKKPHPSLVTKSHTLPAEPLMQHGSSPILHQPRKIIPLTSDPSPGVSPSITRRRIAFQKEPVCGVFSSVGFLCWYVVSLINRRWSV